MKKLAQYEETLREIETTLGLVPGFMKAMPREVLISEWPLFKKYTLGQSMIPAKYRELIGLAVAANLKCPYCQLFHREAAKMQGATEAELSEINYLAGYTSMWSAAIHAQNYDMSLFEKESKQMGEHLKKVIAASPAV